jgi:N-methylhydantoinase B/oxoprolinase/acetone carboxylase alpha subunit
MADDEEKDTNEAPKTQEEVEEEALEKLGLPFPTARVVRILKSNFKKEHQIKADVKIAANQLMGDILVDIARTMDNEEFFTLSIEHFNKAARKYKMVDLQSKRIEKIKMLLLKQKTELEQAIMEIETADY